MMKKIKVLGRWKKGGQRQTGEVQEPAHATRGSVIGWIRAWDFIFNHLMASESFSVSIV